MSPDERPARATGAHGRLLGRWVAARRPALPILVILVVAAILRIYGYNWDEGTNLHPDERGIVTPIRNIGLSHSWAEFWSPASPLNPHFSAYGHLPFYATALFSHILGWLGRTIGGSLSGLSLADVSDAGIIESGRVLSGLADTGTLLFVYLIGRLVYDRSVALLAALLGAFTVLDLEFAHFANVDTYLAFCATGALYFCVRIARYGRPRDYAWAGAWLGFALACKVSAAPLIVPLVVAHIYRGAERRIEVDAAGVSHGDLRLSAGASQGGASRPARRALPANPLLLLLALVVAVVAVFVTMPYAFIDFTNWWSQVWTQLQLAQGITESPFTRKFSGLPAYWYPLQQLMGWTLGPPLGLAAVAGVVWAAWRQVRLRRGSELILLAWVVVFFAATGGQYMKFLRYMLPLTPVLTLFAAALLVAIWRLARPSAVPANASPKSEMGAVGLALTGSGLTDHGRDQTLQGLPATAAMADRPATGARGAPAQTFQGQAASHNHGVHPVPTVSGARSLGRLTPRGWLARGIVVVAVALTVLYGLARENVYTTENTRLAATRWMAAHIPTGSRITVEDWDETLPYPPSGLVVPAYNARMLSILGPGDSPTTVPMFVQALQSADYITISSSRVMGSVAHQPGRYPYSIRWYDLLFGNKLNFRLTKSFKDAPHLGPFVINDYQAVPRADQYTHTHLWYEADQNYSEYDAPPVYIFKRVGTIDPAKATALLTDNGRLAPTVAAYDPTHPMLLPPAVERADQKAPTYNSVFSPSNPLAQVPLLSWLVMVELLGLLALPLVMRACGGLLRDGGYALTKLGGVLIVGYVTWLAASLRLATYSRGLILAACLLLLVLSLVLGLRPRALWATLRARRRGVMWAELVFLGAFLAFVAVRAAYPDLWHMTWGGERTQEVSFMNAILRSQHFPPADPWFAGGTLNYYYYGQYLTGMLMKLTGIPVATGFNLALPTLYALTLSIAFSIGYNATGRAWVGGAAAALEGVLGNLGMVGQFAALAPAHAAPSFVPGVAGLRDAFGGLFAVLTHQNGVQLPSDFFWGSSRILSAPTSSAINEYPIWSFMYGDMHAHVIDIPIVLGVILLALAVSGLGSDRRADVAGSAGVSPVPAFDSEQAEVPALPVAPFYRLRIPQLLLLGALMAVVAGATGPTNLWDLPTSLLLLVAGFGLRGWFALGRRGWPLVLRDLVLPGGVLGLLCLALYRPFYASVLGISSGFTFLAPSTPTDQYLLHLGIPLFLLVSFLALFLQRQTRPLDRLERLGTALQFTLYYRDRLHDLPRLYRLADGLARRRRVGENRPVARLSAHLLLFGALLTLGLLIAGFTTLALIAALLTPATIALVEACVRSRWLDPRQSQPFALVLAIMGLGLTAIPDFVMQNEAGRMNTFFKLYNQAWPLLALSGALALAALVPPRRRAVPAEERAPAVPTRTPVPALALTTASLTRRLAPLTAAPPVDDAERRGPGLKRPWQGPDLKRSAWVSQARRPSPPWDMPLAALAASAADSGSAGASSALATGSAGGAPAPASDVGADGRNERWGLRPLWWAALAALVAGGALFPIFGTYTHLQLRSSWSQMAEAKIPTGLDGAAFVRALYPGDAAAIDWINGHITGMPVLLTSDRGDYRDFATKVTMLTGLPNVISWAWEDQQERYSGQARPAKDFPPVWVNQFDSGRVTWTGGTGGHWVTNLPRTSQPAVGNRSADVETIYNTPDPSQALALLRQYHVSYIYVGIAERGDPNSYDEEVRVLHYPRVGFDPAGLAKFDRMVSAGQLQVAYHKLGVTIYKVVG
ncbi:MAG: DUF2298 domain-containing protein [Chloroflexi bacterium]|nr:DUF2298 domain-containing protein [Chloroflexota bacterium]